MSKLYFFLEPSGYNKYIAAAAEGMPNAKVFGGFKNRRKEKVFKWHNAWPLNNLIELPFKGFWCESLCREIPTGCDYILMAESFHLTYSKKFLTYIRSRFQDAKICFLFSNPVGNYNLSKVKRFSGFYDAIITFAKDDADRYGFLYSDSIPMRLPDRDTSIPIVNDVFFVGANKGRLHKILSIYEKLTSQGLKCKFYIVDVPKENQLQDDGIIYNQRISYDEVLKQVQASRCVLEILQKGCNYVSIKTCEAIHYHKKLLTTNVSANESGLYNDQYIQIIKKVEDINASFVLKDVPDAEFESAGLVETYEPLIKFLDNYFGN